MDDLTPTSYAILGLLAIRPWTTYELAKQMERTINRHWPSARSKHYAEPKRLAALGLATATKEAVGSRPRTVYAITPKGRRALAGWLSTPGGPPSLESEQLTRVFFADHGTPADALRTLADMRRWAAEQLRVFGDAARANLAGTAQFPDRIAVNALGAKLLVDYYKLLYDWSVWASGVVAMWPETMREADPQRRVYEDIVRIADQVLFAEASPG